MTGRGMLAALLAMIAPLATLPGSSDAREDSAQPVLWAVYYAAELPASAFVGYDLLVFDGRNHPELAPLKERGIRLFGYLSLGEAATYEPHYAEVEQMGLLQQRNEYWPDSRMIDLRDPRWTQMLLERLIPAVLQRGFDGIFLDTLDNAGHMEREEPERFAGMTEAALRLVRAIRRHYPEIPIILNRGYELLPALAPDIDLVLGESIRTDYDFQSGRYGWVPEPLYRQQVEILEGARRANPKLGILTLDYWDPTDTATITKIYAEERANGFSPYVATIALDRLVPEPTP